MQLVNRWADPVDLEPLGQPIQAVGTVVDLINVKTVRTTISMTPCRWFRDIKGPIRGMAKDQDKEAVHSVEVIRDIGKKENRGGLTRSDQVEEIDLEMKVMQGGREVIGQRVGTMGALITGGMRTGRTGLIGNDTGVGAHVGLGMIGLEMMTVGRGMIGIVSVTVLEIATEIGQEIETEDEVDISHNNLVTLSHYTYAILSMACALRPP
jgi:hypothetical protein